MTARPYEGTIDEQEISELAVEIGRTIEQAGEVGFVLTYHAEPGVGGSGVLNLLGSGIPQQQLGVLLAQALEHNADHGCTA